MSPGYSSSRIELGRVSGSGSHGTVSARRRAPHGYGPDLDERVVEWTWTIEPSSGNGGLDAGSVFTPLILRSGNQEIYIDHILVDMEWIDLNPGIHLFGDFANRSSVATVRVNRLTQYLEHGGGGPRQAAVRESWARSQPPADRVAYRGARSASSGGSRPGGRCSHRALRRLRTTDVEGYEASGIPKSKNRLREGRTETYYRYSAEGWQCVSADECADCEYCNIVRTQIAPDNAAGLCGGARARRPS